MRRGGARRWLLIGGAVAVVAAGVAGYLALTNEGSAGTPRPSRAHVEAYEDTVHPLLRRGGQVVEQGMKPAVQTIARNEPTQATFQAVSWVAELEAVHRETAAVAPPRGLERAHTLFLESLTLYTSAAQTIGAAAIATGEPREKLLADAVAKARQADDVYDKASSMLQSARRRAGLPASERFPKGEDE